MWFQRIEICYYQNEKIRDLMRVCVRNQEAFHISLSLLRDQNLVNKKYKLWHDPKFNDASY